MLLTFVLKIILGISLIALSYRVSEDLKPEFFGGGAILLITTLILDSVKYLWLNWRRFKFIIKTKYIALLGKEIRFSMSYQYRIKVNDKYLLVKNSNPNWTWYQHVGGKYKRTEKTNKILSDLNAVDDIKMKTSGLKKGDLAVFVPAKNAVKFLDWFNSTKDREMSHWREFYEELLSEENPILNKDIFPYINYEFVGSVVTGVKKTPIESGWNCWEVLQYDVLDVILNDEQLEELEELQNKETDYFKWASAALINRLGYNEDEQVADYRIGAHAKWVLNMKWTKQ